MSIPRTPPWWACAGLPWCSRAKRKLPYTVMAAPRSTTGTAIRAPATAMVRPDGRREGPHRRGGHVNPVLVGRRGQGSWPAAMAVTVLLAPERVAPVDRRDFVEVMGRRRRRCPPLQGAPIPRIGGRARPPAEAVSRVHEHDQHAGAQREGADGGDHVPEVPAGSPDRCRCGGACRAPRKCWGKKARLKPTNISQKCELAQPLVEHPAGDLGPPVVEAGEEAEDAAAEEHVVEVGHDEVGVGLLEVDRRRGVHDARRGRRW